MWFHFLHACFRIYNLYNFWIRIYGISLSKLHKILHPCLKFFCIKIQMWIWLVSILNEKWAMTLLVKVVSFLQRWLAAWDANVHLERHNNSLLGIRILMFEKILLNRHQTISNLLIAKNLLIRALYMQNLVLLVSFRSEIKSRMSICKSRDTLLMKFKNISFTSNSIFSILKIDFILCHWLIVESLWGVHVISVFSQILLILKTLP